MRPFVYNALPARVVFGSGTCTQVAQEVKGLSCQRALVLTDSSSHSIAVGERVKQHLGDLCAGMYTNATMHTPRHVTDDALKVVSELNVDCVVAVGGGSTIGLGKAIVLNHSGPAKIKQVVLPTTYAGSEATPIIGQSETDPQTGKTLKTTQKTLKVLPDVIIYDIDLTLSLPAQLTVTSGINAIAHAVEALWSTDANPITTSLAEQGIASLARALPLIAGPDGDLTNAQGRSEALFGAYACGTCLGSSSMALHHKLAHTLGGSFGMPHAETHTVLLPHTIAYNAPYAPDAVNRVARALGLVTLADGDTTSTSTTTAAQGLYDLAKGLGAPFSLKQLGFKGEDLNEAATIASKAPYPNPAPLEREKLLQLLRNAYEGTRPE